MMTMLIPIFIMLPMIMIKENPNPVKMSVALLMSSVFLFMLIYFSTALVWYPMIYFLIFMGGILMMFMILSSVLPNEKSKKAKMIYLILLIFASSILELGVSFPSGETYAAMIKTVMNSSQNLSVMILLMILYFFLALLIVSKQENPLRTQVC